ncbi:Mitochondrial import receptor subunit TOM40 1 [Chionoecetes opilio]|uniref:Mitochondrial import receptor subunit TOM40 1 n=1 Tax=Chionoecetes opilio TaxID=41210 RepID=A0A8J5CR92_CHIOP|nr:Mitochondrial import receptor subunit TOM40 1 [Chionoecetes opilio]
MAVEEMTVDDDRGQSRWRTGQQRPKSCQRVFPEIQQSKWQATQLTLDWRGTNHTTSLTLGNVDLVNGSGVAVTHYLQQVTKRLALGTELAYQYGPQVPGGHIAVHSVAGRYTGDSFTASGTLGGTGVHLCYYQKATEQLQFGVELETSLRLQESVASMAYQLEIPKANTVFRALILPHQIQQSKWQATQLTLDWRGTNHTTSLTLGNVDLVNGSGVAVTHYLQQVTKRLALGTELAYQYGPQVPGGHIAVHSVAGRYTGDSFTASGTLGGTGVHLCYYQKATEQLQFGVELETSLRLQESVASMAYQLEIPKANTVFRVIFAEVLVMALEALHEEAKPLELEVSWLKTKLQVFGGLLGTLDTNWTVGAVMEKKLMPLPFTLALSAMLNHPKNQFRLGCGFIIG